MGRAYDASTDKVRTLAFDPILKLRENTVEHPIYDGDRSNNLATNGWFYGLGWINPRNGLIKQPVYDGAVHW